MNKNDKILILGARGLVGSNITLELKDNGYSNKPDETMRKLLDVTRLSELGMEAKI